jgi:hypothetical protein
MKIDKDSTITWVEGDGLVTFTFPPGAERIMLHAALDNTFEVGERVRQTNHHHISGIVTKIYPGRDFDEGRTFVELDNGGPGNSYLSTSLEHFPVPAEPPMGSVVVDQAGFAFQRMRWWDGQTDNGKDAWSQANDGTLWNWELLVLNFGVTEDSVVYWGKM